MPHHEKRSVRGTITHVFGHRFVLQTADGPVLADITPKGLDAITLAVGALVEISGEMKPTELKVSTFALGEKVVRIDHGKPGHGPGAADLTAALAKKATAGYAIVGEPRRKPKHFEVLARKRDELFELHVELDGHIRKSKPGDQNDPKWA